MEIIKDALTARKDFMTLLTTAPPPFPPEIEAKFKGLKLGSPSSVPSASLSIPLSSGSATLAPAPQNLVSIQIPPAAAVAPQPVTTVTLSVVPHAALSATPQGAPIPAYSVTPPIPKRPTQSSRNLSGNGWKWVFAIALLAGGIYLVRRYQKKKEQENK